MKRQTQLLMKGFLRRLLLIDAVRRISRVKTLQIVQLRECRSDSKLLAVASEDVIALPDYGDSGENSGFSLLRTFPALKLHELRDPAVTVNHRFPNLIVGDQCIIPDREEPGPYWVFANGFGYKTGGIVGADSDRLFLRHLPEHKVPGAALYLGTTATYNWSHWLLHFLPSLFLANSEGAVPRAVPVLVPAVAFDSPSHREALELLLEGRPVFRMEENVSYRFSKIYWPDSPLYGPPFTTDKSRRVPLAMHREVMSRFITRLQGLASGPESNSDTPRRIFIARRDSGSRAVNMQELRPVLEKWGFSVLHLEDYSIGEKARLISNATHLVGPSGSGFANLAFAKPGLSALSFTNFRAPTYDNFVPALASLVQTTLSYISARPETKVDGVGRYAIDPAIVDRRLSQMCTP
jgi:hypothetical protein